MVGHAVGSLIFRRHVSQMRQMRSIRLELVSSLCTLRDFHSSRSPRRDAPQRNRGRAGAFPVSRDPYEADAQPARQIRKSRPFLQRVSLLDKLQDVGTASSSPDALAVSPRHSSAHESAAAPYVSPPQLISVQRQAKANSVNDVSRRNRPTHSAADVTATSVPAAASLQLQEHQRALRDAFTHARQYHNVKLKKDPRVYRAECKAFRQAHQGRSPTAQEVSPTVAVPLAPVSALMTLAHTDSKRSHLHHTAEDAILLHNAVAKNELVKSSAPQLVRCLRCFHVYTARPRTLWGGEVEQSGIEYEKLQAQLAMDRQLQRRPWLRKRVASVGRRQRAQQDDPRCCPLCGSARAQWMMEYVHHHTHEKR
ncbi:hypothetical protein ABL78_0931 [Leptomonas seymouri]|uniref:Uncharacterized protein n=1 Tax=Leptomonas seymouri TaxID=5684 RepID=A0A0N1I846_LEPSE|nr:hypothetical protein ABL78_0931 [Leptomonas seymouri]|eukprot:KPI89963.1 hypothetical protein ABL78_0931 [Leptomonas seymouri]